MFCGTNIRQEPLQTLQSYDIITKRTPAIVYPHSHDAEGSTTSSCISSTSSQTYNRLQNFQNITFCQHSPDHGSNVPSKRLATCIAGLTPSKYTNEISMLKSAFQANALRRHIPLAHISIILSAEDLLQHLTPVPLCSLRTSGKNWPEVEKEWMLERTRRLCALSSILRSLSVYERSVLLLKGDDIAELRTRFTAAYMMYKELERKANHSKSAATNRSTDSLQIRPRDAASVLSLSMTQDPSVYVDKLAHCVSEMQRLKDDYRLAAKRAVLEALQSRVRLRRTRTYLLYLFLLDNDSRFYAYHCLHRLLCLSRIARQLHRFEEASARIESMERKHTCFRHWIRACKAVTHKAPRKLWATIGATTHHVSFATSETNPHDDGFGSLCVTASSTQVGSGTIIHEHATSDISDTARSPPSVVHDADAFKAMPAPLTLTVVHSPFSSVRIVNPIKQSPAASSEQSATQDSPWLVNTGNPAQDINAIMDDLLKKFFSSDTIPAVQHLPSLKMTPAMRIPKTDSVESVNDAQFICCKYRLMPLHADYATIGDMCKHLLPQLASLRSALLLVRATQKSVILMGKFLRFLKTEDLLLFSSTQQTEPRLYIFAGRVSDHGIVRTALLCWRICLVDKDLDRLSTAWHDHRTLLLSLRCILAATIKSCSNSSLLYEQLLRRTTFRLLRQCATERVNVRVSAACKYDERACKKKALLPIKLLAHKYHKMHSLERALLERFSRQQTTIMFREWVIALRNGYKIRRTKKRVFQTWTARFHKQATLRSIVCSISLPRYSVVLAREAYEQSSAWRVSILGSCTRGWRRLALERKLLQGMHEQYLVAGAYAKKLSISIAWKYWTRSLMYKQHENKVAQRHNKELVQAAFCSLLHRHAYFVSLENRLAAQCGDSALGNANRNLALSRDAFNGMRMIFIGDKHYKTALCCRALGSMLSSSRAVAAINTAVTHYKVFLLTGALQSLMHVHVHLLESARADIWYIIRLSSRTIASLRERARFQTHQTEFADRHCVLARRVRIYMLLRRVYYQRLVTREAERIGNLCVKWYSWRKLRYAAIYGRRVRALSERATLYYRTLLSRWAERFLEKGPSFAISLDLLHVPVTRGLDQVVVAYESLPDNVRTALRIDNAYCLKHAFELWRSVFKRRASLLTFRGPDY